MYDEKNAIPHNHVVREKEIVFLHTPSVHLYNEIKHNGKHLHTLENKLDENTHINKHQTDILRKHTYMLKKGLNMQAADAVRDRVHMRDHRKASQERHNLHHDIKHNLKHISQANNQLGKSLHNQSHMRKEHHMLKHDVAGVSKQVSGNKYKLNDVLNNQSVQMSQLSELDDMMNGHIQASNEHNAVQHGLVFSQNAHDNKLDGLVASQAVHNVNQNGMIVEQANIKNLVLEHDANAAAHSSRMGLFASNQAKHNDKVSYHMNKENDHMAKQGDFMVSQDLHMNDQQVHMNLQKDHMDEMKNHDHPHGHSLGILPIAVVSPVVEQVVQVPSNYGEVLDGSYDVMKMPSKEKYEHHYDSGMYKQPSYFVGSKN